MAQKTPEQIDAEIERLREQRREAEQRRRQQQERAIVRAAERAGILRQHWTSRDLETAMRALARDGLAALRAQDTQDPAPTSDARTEPDAQ